VQFVVDERGLTVRFLNSVLFDLGSATLRPEALGMLDAVGMALKNTTHYIRVEGHADNLPINTVQFPSNWELSASRSIAVTRYLINKHGADPRRLSSLGYGEFRPLYPNDSDENRARNRRVDIVVLRTERAGGEIGAIDIIKR
jgi:chemotaxis protein MotB